MKNCTIARRRIATGMWTSASGISFNKCASPPLAVGDTKYSLPFVNPQLVASTVPSMSTAPVSPLAIVTGAIGLPEGAEMIMPGDNVEMKVELITPIAIEIGQRFAIREGGRTVGAGAIVSIGA